jgi:hypothetical protein
LIRGRFFRTSLPRDVPYESPLATQSAASVGCFVACRYQSVTFQKGSSIFMTALLLSYNNTNRFVGANSLSSTWFDRRRMLVSAML